MLTDNKMALSKFLLSIDWSSESEMAELPSLLELWKVRACVVNTKLVEAKCRARY